MVAKLTGNKEPACEKQMGDSSQSIQVKRMRQKSLVTT
jgi:hypothetical protein